MATVTTKAKIVATAAKAAAAKPAVERVAKDEKFQQHVREAYGSARTIYDELFLEKPPAVLEPSPGKARKIATKLASDPQLQEELRNAIMELRGASLRAKKAAKPSHKARNTLLLSGILIGVLYNPKTGPDTRKWIKEKVFGPEETFEFEA
jgi:hypothetical protein